MPFRIALGGMTAGFFSSLSSLQLPNDARLKKVYNDFMLSCMKLRKTDHIGGSEGIRLFIHGIIMILRRQLAVSVSGRPCYV
jgi:hypothetical protein